MEFRIASSFTDSLTKLSPQEQKAVKMTAFDLQLNPATPSMNLHRIRGAKDPNFWSIRVNRDIRLIVHKTESSLLLCYVDHHDDAYKWAEDRKLQTHPKTGAAQFVKIRETVKQVTVPQYVEAEEATPPERPLFADTSREELLRYGVPEEWLDDVYQADEDSVLDLAAHLPEEAAEALLNLAVGITPEVSPQLKETIDPFAHPDAQRRFRVVGKTEELQRALEYPWEKWAIFLHPAQRKLVERDYNGPARVAGSAGTGKTVVALHRAVFLARHNPNARVLLTTFSDSLAHALDSKLRRLIHHEPRLAERLEVHSLSAIGERLYELNIGAANIAARDQIRELLEEASSEDDNRQFSLPFLLSEWQHVVDAWQLNSWEAYRDVLRLGRKRRLPESQRESLWAIFERLRSKLRDRGLITQANMYGQLTAWLDELDNPPFDFAVVDEAQDVSIAQLRFLGAIGRGRPNSLFFAGDLGQRIFEPPFSWKALGIDIRGRSYTLRINYRTTHQIRVQADRLLDAELTDVDGNVEERDQTISVFNGPQPTIAVLDSPNAEIERVAKWLSDRVDEGIAPREIGVFVRSPAELNRARSAVEQAEIPFTVLDKALQQEGDSISLSTMHFAKGLEFRAVAVMACDDEVIPLQERIETVADMSDLEEVYNTERQLLYVACTRARDQLLVTATAPASEFLEDLQM